MGLYDTPCQVSIDTANYYRQMDKEEALAEEVHAFIDDAIDEITSTGSYTSPREYCYGIGGKGNWIENKIYLEEAVDEYMDKEDKWGDFEMLALATTFAKDKDEAQMNFEEFIKDACEYYFTECIYEKMEADYIKTMENDYE